MNCLTQLVELGLNGRQANVYIALLQAGSASAIELAKATGYKHPTVYDVLEILKAKRLVSESFSGGRKLFSAEDPIKLQEDLEKKFNTLDDILPSLKAMYDSRGVRPKIRFFQGEKWALEINRQLLNAQSKKYYYFGSVKEMFDTLSEKEMREYYNERIKRGIWSYAIRVRSKESEYDYMQGGEHNLRQVRYFPKNINEDIAGLYLYDDTVAIMSAQKENYAMTIESRELFLLLHTIWQCMWEISTE